MKTILLIALFYPVLAVGQVYRCDGPDGPIFSDMECGPAAKEVILSDTSSGLGGQVSIKNTQADLAQKKLQREQDKYKKHLRGLRSSNVAAIDSQISALTAQKRLANDTPAGVAYAAGIDEQIAALQAYKSNVNKSYREQITQMELGQQ